MTENVEEAASPGLGDGPAKGDHEGHHHAIQDNGIAEIDSDTPLPLIPLIPRTNRPLLTDWPRRATTDWLQHRCWRLDHPDCNFGVVVGNGVGVLDIDTKNDPYGAGGYSTLIDLEDSLGIDLSPLPLVRTPHGSHLYFRYNGMLASRVPWLPHLDVKADRSDGTVGHQVAAPGTVRDVDGREITYELIRGSLDVIPYAPVALVNAIRHWRWSSPGHPGSPGDGTPLMPVEHYLANGLGEPGTRDNTCHKLACSLWRKHWNDPQLVEAIIADAWRVTPQGSHPFPWSEAKKKIRVAREWVAGQMEAEAAFLRNMEDDR